jgi:hypothetical protein
MKAIDSIVASLDAENSADTELAAEYERKASSLRDRVQKRATTILVLKEHAAKATHTEHGLAVTITRALEETGRAMQLKEIVAALATRGIVTCSGSVCVAIRGAPGVRRIGRGLYAHRVGSAG